MEFDKNNILLNIRVKDKLDLFNTIADYALKRNIIDNKDLLVNAFLEREKEVSTGLQESFAIPHAKSNFIKEPTVFFLKLVEPIEWETFDGQPVSNVFALLVPSKYEGTLHLEMISKIATSLLEDEFINSVKNSSNIDEIEKQIAKAMKGEY
ncbi:fructose PTS transporter subunit IIA [Streptococcus uberis]|uniref:PTS sugar transporter subunit IIA n=1 Tax=Streptococcus uberis TaxID=1349 RepID=UPI0027DBC3F5|nr:fructose PTS transporter subunit IIA [Streptococcus uberis]MCK1158683.1 fructose PTS transporter subunit IIA [Streptococcus uberis]MCK1224793.1 fructose PTS transporter subunit IIA [Streptococcus uberis]MCK1246461.1 fructose PTS transporter subunit IIA [Streptococcus uberis]